MERKTFDTNEFEGRLKITNFGSKDTILEKINIYLEKYNGEEKENLYEIEKETSNSLLLNFHKNTEIANYISRKLKLLQLGNKNFSKLNCHVTIKVINPNQKKKDDEKKEKDEKDEKNSQKENKEKKKRTKNSDIYNIDTKNNPRLNKILSKSLNFNRRNINKYLSPDNNKMKIYESIFLNGGPYMDKNDIEKENFRKNKAQMINKKEFIPYISKQTVLKNAHMIENYLSLEPARPNNFQFREVQKSKWVGEHNFYV